MSFRVGLCTCKLVNYVLYLIEFKLTTMKKILLFILVFWIFNVPLVNAQDFYLDLYHSSPSENFRKYKWYFKSSGTERVGLFK